MVDRLRLFEVRGVLFVLAGSIHISLLFVYYFYYNAFFFVAGHINRATHRVAARGRCSADECGGGSGPRAVGSGRRWPDATPAGVAGSCAES